MSTSTTNMSLLKAVDGDNSKTYLETSLGGSLDTIDAHDHSLSNNTKGLPITKLPSAITGGITVGSGNITFSAATQGLTCSGGFLCPDANSAVGNTAVAQLCTGQATLRGFYFLQTSGADGAIIHCQGGSHNTALIYNSGNFSTTANTASKYNIYWSVANSRYEIQNNVGGTLNYGGFYFEG